LKPINNAAAIADMADFPRLKSRGPIEASRKRSTKSKATIFPRLKSRGPIEAVIGDCIAIFGVPRFPRLKSRGPIEARRRT